MYLSCLSLAYHYWRLCNQERSYGERGHRTYEKFVPFGFLTAPSEAHDSGIFPALNVVKTNK